ncbi:MAG: pantoate--beta-alanine ligase [Proteobacteria bacterium]|nr:pantoate--beta-alanine ligase [Pseudomonadota bacterium]
MNIQPPKPAATPAIARDAVELQAHVATWRSAGQSIGLVPTMGALHDGHLSLIRAIKGEADRVVVSIFVNPTQFGPGEDFKTYPRDTEADLGKITAAGGDLVYLPGLGDMYPDGVTSDISAGPLGDVMCGASRPGHFDGVASVVARLLRQCLPDVAIFGEKDYQQLLVIRHMTATLNLPVRIIAAPILRQPDGLALSSRNRYLSAEDRVSAAALSATLRDLAARAGTPASNDGASLRALEAEGRQRLLDAGFTRVDYLDFRDGNRLERAEQASGDTRVFAAAVIGGARLIDNMAVTA